MTSSFSDMVVSRWEIYEVDLSIKLRLLENLYNKCYIYKQITKGSLQTNVYNCITTMIKVDSA